jgi:hypothetical protein
MFSNPEKWLSKSCGTRSQLIANTFLHILLYCMGVLEIFLYVAKDISIEKCILHTASLFFIGVIMPAWYLYLCNKMLNSKK